MRQSVKKWAICALFAAVLLLPGCGAAANDSLYRLPKLPTEYESLETLIDALIDGGAEYAAPTSGSNLQSVQMVDLDGDGEEEAVAFFRRPGDERPMKIYVFRATRDSYEQFCVIEGTAHSIYSINYVDLDGDGWREILAGIRSDLDVQNLSVWSLAAGTPQQLLLAGYSRYTAHDMDGDGRQDLIVLRSDEENFAVADYYAWNATELALRSSFRLSGTVAELSRLTNGVLSGGENALFVTSVTQDGGAITDILTVGAGVLHSVKRGADIGRTFRFLEVYPGDVNADGITEVPEPAPFRKTDPEGDSYYRICWRQYSAEGEETLVRETYQEAQSGWNLILPSSWDDRVTVRRTSGTEGSSVTFSELHGAEEKPIVVIYAFTGADRTQLASRTGRIVLARQAEVSYAADIYNGGDDWIDEQTLRESFSLIQAEWTTGEN